MAFIPFITAGDPDLDTTAEALVRLDEAGASVIELGVPYSVRAAPGRHTPFIDFEPLCTALTEWRCMLTSLDRNGVASCSRWNPASCRSHLNLLMVARRGSETAF